MSPIAQKFSSSSRRKTLSGGSPISFSQISAASSSSLDDEDDDEDAGEDEDDARARFARVIARSRVDARGGSDMREREETRANDARARASSARARRRARAVGGGERR